MEPQVQLHWGQGAEGALVSWGTTSALVVSRRSSMKLALVVVLICGCGASRQPMAASVPGCPGARVVVPRGCYVQSVAGTVEIRCPGNTSRYTCKGGQR